MREKERKSDELYDISTRHSLDEQNYCRKCGKHTAFISIDEAAAFLRTDRLRALRFINHCKIHNRTNEVGEPEVCLGSVASKYGSLQRSHETVLRTKVQKPGE